MPAASAKKDQYILKLIELLKNHPQILIVHADHVGSNQMQQVRKSLRGKATILMGKNTMIRKVIRSFLGQDELRVEGAMEQIKPMEQLERLLPLVKENIGLVFCKTDLNEIRKVIVSNTRPAAAKAGTFAPCDVVVPAGPTGLDPSQTSFFQALNIATKINKGQIEIINNVNLIAKGTKVGSSEVALLGKLDIKPFAYGLTIRNVYDDGSIYSPEVLDLTAEEIMKKFMNGVQNVAAISRAIGFPTAASLPHVLLDGFKNVVACVMGTAYTFKQAEALMNAAKAPAAVAAAPAAGKAAPAAAAAPAKKVEEEEEDMDLGSGGLFGDF